MKKFINDFIQKVFSNSNSKRKKDTFNFVLRFNHKVFEEMYLKYYFYKIQKKEFKNGNKNIERNVLYSNSKT